MHPQRKPWKGDTTFMDIGFCVTPDGVYFSICDPYLGFRFALPQAKKFHPCGVQDLGIQPREKLGESGKRQDDASTLHPRLKRDDKALPSCGINPISVGNNYFGACVVPLPV